MSQSGVIDGLQFARDSGELRGTLELEQLSRLAETPCQSSGIGYFLRGGLNQAGKPSIEVKASGRLQLVCQRCLEPLVFDVDVDVELELCADPQVIARADDEIDRILAERAMSVAQLVEDEIILVLPQAPRHESCGVEERIPEQGRESPFNVLALMKKRDDR